MTDADYLAAWHQVVLPLAAEFQPDLVIVIFINILIAFIDVVNIAITSNSIEINFINIVIIFKFAIVTIIMM